MSASNQYTAGPDQGSLGKSLGRVLLGTAAILILARAARDNAPGAPDRLRILYRGQLLRLDERALRAGRRSVLGPGIKRNAVRPKAAGWVLDALWRQTEELLAGPAPLQGLASPKWPSVFPALDPQKVAR